MKRKLILRSYMLAILLVLLLSLVGTAWAGPSGSRTYTLDADFDEGTLVNLNHDDVADQLQLDSAQEAFEFIWVAASGRGTIIKIDTVTGDILGEYRSAPDGMEKNPSRTTVDGNGNVWAGNRNEAGGGQGSVVHIGLQENGQCVDRNSNGVIDTSTGLGDIKAWTNDGGADTNGGVSTAADECIIHFVRTAGTYVRTLAVDASNNIWIGGFGNRVHQLHNSSGVPIGSPISLGCGGYGGIIDANGVLWSASLYNSLGRIDPSTPTPTTSCINLGRPSYGLGIDSSGNIWNSNWVANTITRLDPSGTITGIFSTVGYSGDRGVTVTPVDDDVWVANSSGNNVSRLNNDGSFDALVTVGSMPTGLAVDAAGKVWVTNYSSHSAMRIDPATNLVDLTVNLGSGAYPYNYSDMTGATLIAPPGTGTWTVVYDSTQVGASWSLVSWNSDEPGDSQITVKVASSMDGVTFGPEVSVGNGATPAVADGQYLKVIVSFQRATTGESPILYDLTVSTNRPPVADANGPYFDDEGSPVTFDGTGSSDPDGDSLTYDWDFGDGTVALDAGPTPSHIYDDNGNYVACLTVTDPFGLSDTNCSHTYQLVSQAGITWQEAKVAAEAMSSPGCDAHLVTITSQEEQDALYDLFNGDLQGKWYGGFQDEGVFVPDEGWNWVTGELWDYTNWASEEPNDTGGDEHFLIGWASGWAWNDEANLGNVTGYVVEFECGAAVTINNVAPTATFNAPTYAVADDPFDLSLTDPYDPSNADTAAGFEYDFDCGSGYDGWSSSHTATCPSSPDEVGDRTVKGKIQDKDGGVSEYTATVTVLPPSAATNSSLCYYDFDEADGQQFKLIFTPDMQIWPAYKLPASNPGQFFYNVFYVGTDPASFDISIPEPFEFQGANPVHVYTGVSVIQENGFKCFVPEGEIYAGDLEGLDGLTSPSGMLYVAVHLDYGLKGSTGYVPSGENHALDAGDEVTVLIQNYGSYTFAVSGSQVDSRTIQNVNDFKKIPGFGGLVTDGVGDPVPGVTVDIYLNGEFFDSATTDEDGWFMYVYKHTGKPADFSVKLDGMEVTGTLKANKFVEANFEYTP